MAFDLVFPFREGLRHKDKAEGRRKKLKGWAIDRMGNLQFGMGQDWEPLHGGWRGHGRRCKASENQARLGELQEQGTRCFGFIGKALSAPGSFSRQSIYFL